ncbi:MAG: hypothetical protein AB7H90_01085 [Alphaproteobacteria bacterium]
MATRAADDSETIARRLAELKNERTQVLNCICRKSDDGKIIINTICPVHKDQPAAPASLSDLANRLPDDDWATLKQQAQCPALSAVSRDLGPSMRPLGRAIAPLSGDWLARLARQRRERSHQDSGER